MNSKNLVGAVLISVLAVVGCGEAKPDDAPDAVSADCGQVVYGVGCPGTNDPHPQSTCMIGEKNDISTWKQVSGCTTTFRLIANPSMTYQTECVAVCPQ